MTAEPAEKPTPDDQPGGAPPAEAPQSEPPAGEPGVDQPPAGETAEPEGPPEPVQPADVDPDAGGKVIELHTRKGALTLRADQTSLDANQRAALVAIGIDVAKDPLIEPHVRPFMHMCQVRDLDPWAREAYLIGRGKDDYRKFTMQVGIDGYRKMAGATGRFLRVKEVLWTGQDDDDRSWRAVDDGEGGVIMRRVWFDQWPAGRGYPGAAKVIIEHLEPDMRTVTTTSATADWSMYAPFSPKYEWSGGRKTKVRGPDGKDVLELNDMWQKGYAHMLAKCAEALAHRKAFPAAVNGFYVHEEMHRLDQEEQNRAQRQTRSKLAAAYTAATGQVTTGPAQGAPETPQEPDTAPSGPLPVGEVVSDVVDAVVVEDGPQEPAQDGAVDQGDPVDRTAALHAELSYLSEVLGHPERSLARRAMIAAKVDLDALTDEHLLPLVAGLRPMAVQRLRDSGRTGEADTYGAVAPDAVIDVAVLFGDDDTPDPRLNVDPEKRHDYVDNGGTCGVEGCGRFEDELPHPPVEG